MLLAEMRSWRVVDGVGRQLLCPLLLGLRTSTEFLSGMSRTGILSTLHVALRSNCFSYSVLVNMLNWSQSYKHYKTDLWHLDKLSCRWHHQQAWVELRWTSLLICNFLCNRFLSSQIFDVNWTYKREWQQTNKTQAVAKTGRGAGSRVASQGF